MITINREECKKWRAQQPCGLGGQDNIPLAESFIVLENNKEGIVLRSLINVDSGWEWPYYIEIDGVKWRFASHLDCASNGRRITGLAQYHKND